MKSPIINSNKFTLLTYSRVPNKRGGENIRGGGLEMVQYNNNRGGWNNRGGVPGEIENSRFFGKHVSVIYLCER